MKNQVAVLSGDGIGPEVMQSALVVLQKALGEKSSDFRFEEAAIGGHAIDVCGEALPPSTLKLCEESQAILFGSVGGPKWENLPPDKQPERGALLPLRSHFRLFANLRPVRLYPELSSSCPLKEDRIADGIDLLIVRELTGGIYFGRPRGREGSGPDERAFDTMEYSRFEIERIARVAFDAAMNRRKKVTSVDKANVLASAGLLWREVVGNYVQERNSSGSNIELESMYVDNAAMQLILNPGRFDVIVCGNMFGDILSDEASVLAGSLGMLASASLSDNGNFGLYEPCGGSAPDIAGKNSANPIAQILSAAMMLRYTFNMEDVANKIEKATADAIAAGARTQDIVGQDQSAISLLEMTQEILVRI